MANEHLLSDKRQLMILAMADSSMNTSAVARELCMSRTAVIDNLAQIKKITGKDPMKFFELYDLVLLVKAERLRAALEGVNNG